MASYEDMIAQQQKIVDGYDGKVTVDQNDSRLTSIEAERQKAISENNNTYNNLINESNQSYNNMINNTQQYYDNINKTMQEGYEKQSQAQQAQLQATIDNINTQKERAERDYQKEQRGAYSDYQNQTNPYGVQAEQMASNGLNNTGYSETSRTSMYNAYQNRVATARQTLQDALVDYNAQIVSAQNANNTAMAELWSNVYLKIAENALSGFQYKNQLEQNKLNVSQSLTQNRISNENTLQSRYDTRYQNMLSQINQEISNKQSQYNTALSILQSDKKLQEDMRQFEQQMAQSREQFNQQMAYQRERDRIKDAQWQKEYNLSLQKYRASLSNSRTVSSNTKSVSDTKTNNKTSSASVQGAQLGLSKLLALNGYGVR